MSSSGKGQTLVRTPEEVASAWQYAESAARVRGSRVIVEGFIDFDYEITLLTVRACDETGDRADALLRADRARAGQRRLRRIVAAAADVAARARIAPATSPRA